MRVEKQFQNRLRAIECSEITEEFASVAAATRVLKLLRDFNDHMKPTIRIVTRGSNGELRTKDYEKHEHVLKMHTQIGVDDCSTDLSLRGLPIFRGLIGPMADGKTVVRYESPEVFETLTKEWSATRSRSRRKQVEQVET